MKRFVTIALTGVGLAHGALCVFGLPFSLRLDSPGLWLYLAGLATPAIAAVAVATPGAAVRSLLPLRAPPSVYLAAALFQPVLLLGVALVARAVPETPAVVWAPAAGLPLLVVGQAWVVLGEEVGWRGFALPRLLGMMSARRATIILALVWGVWHAPMFFVVGSPQAREPVWLFAAAVLAWSAMHTRLRLQRNTGIVPNMLLHASANVTLNLVVVPAGARPLLAIVYLVAATALLGFLPSRWPGQRTRDGGASTSCAAAGNLDQERFSPGARNGGVE